MPKCKRTEESTRNVPTLLYYVHMATYNHINYKHPQIIIMNFYRLLPYHTQMHFRARLSSRVPDSGQPVMLQTSLATNYIVALKQAPHDIIDFYIILHFYTRRHFLRQPITCARKYCLGQNCHILHCYPPPHFTSNIPLPNIIKNIYYQVGLFLSWSKH